MRARCDGCRARGYRLEGCYVCEMLEEQDRGWCQRGCMDYAHPESDYCRYCIATWPWDGQVAQ